MQAVSSCVCSGGLRVKCSSVHSTDLYDSAALSRQSLMDFLWVCLVIAWPIPPQPFCGFFFSFGKLHQKHAALTLWRKMATLMMRRVPDPTQAASQNLIKRAVLNLEGILKEKHWSQTSKWNLNGCFPPLLAPASAPLLQPSSKGRCLFNGCVVTRVEGRANYNKVKLFNRVAVRWECTHSTHLPPKPDAVWENLNRQLWKYF